MLIIFMDENNFLIYFVEIGQNCGGIGMSICPGKKMDLLYGTPCDRDLKSDINHIKEWGAKVVISLMENHEFVFLKTVDLPQEVMNAGMKWIHLPIVDRGIPDTAFENTWNTIHTDLNRLFDNGSKILVHCRAGLGRTGLVTARFLIDRGVPADSAISLVRSIRPRAIQTQEQEAYLKNVGSLCF